MICILVSMLVLENDTRPVKKIVIEIITEQLNYPDSIQEKNRLKEDLIMGELDIVEVTIKLEEEFNIRIPDEDTETWETVGNVIKYIRGRLERKKK